jgi:hypothetical protein
MDKHTKAPDAKADGEYRDSLGQPNPAIDLEKKNIAEGQKRQEEKDKAARKDD